MQRQQVGLWDTATEDRSFGRPGRAHTDAAVALWLKNHGLSPHYKPRWQHSQRYCGWLDRSDNRRQREWYEAMVRQQWKCWVCGWPITSSRGVDMHHPLGYGHLGEEDPSDLVALHRRKCHYAAHVEMRREQSLDAHWKRAA